eukprot:33420-Pelagomonas_calceolata.AAC.1
MACLVVIILVNVLIIWQYCVVAKLRALFREVKSHLGALMIASQMHELDDFEGHIRQIQRQQAAPLQSALWI